MEIPEHIQKIIDKPSILPQVEKEMHQTIKEGRDIREEARQQLDRDLY